MDNNEVEASGRLYLYADGVSRDAGLAPAIVTNGPAISPDGKLLYHVDTLAKTIWEARITDGGRLEAPRRLLTLESGVGHPDGAVCDAEGCIWLGLFGGWGVRRYDPDGRLMESLAFPVANVTKIAFGGANLDIAYATTARIGLSETALARQPLAGALFAFDPGVKGAPLTPCRL